jgi:hypothetical protein
MEVAKQVPTTEELINADGTLDEGAAGAAIDSVMNQVEEEVKQEREEPADEAEDTTVDEQSDSDDWVTSEDISELVESLGYSEEDMAEFAGPEEFERHVRLLDREMKRVRPGDDQETALEADDISRQKNAKTQQAEQQHRENGKFAKKPEELPQLDETYEDDLREVVSSRDKVIEELQSRLAELEQHLDGTTQNTVLQNFNRILHGQGMEDVFGTEEKPNHENCERGWEEYKAMYNHWEAMGKDVQSDKAQSQLVRRMLNMEFADELKKKTRRDLTKKIKKQSSKISGSSRRQANKEYTGPIEKHPELTQKYWDLVKENG